MKATNRSGLTIKKMPFTERQKVGDEIKVYAYDGWALRGWLNGVRIRKQFRTHSEATVAKARLEVDAANADGAMRAVNTRLCAGMTPRAANGFPPTIPRSRLHSEFIAGSYSLHQTAPSSPFMKPPSMRSSSAFFLQVVVVIIGIGTLGLMLWEPHIEGRNAHATTFEIYFKDPFLAYVYVGSIPFFVALHRAFGLFGHVRRNGTFSKMTLYALRTIKRCAIAIVGFVAGAAIFIVMFGDGEDRPAGVFMCVLVAFAASVIAIASVMFARNLEIALTRRPATG